MSATAHLEAKLGKANQALREAQRKLKALACLLGEADAITDVAVDATLIEGAELALVQARRKAWREAVAEVLGC